MYVILGHTERSAIQFGTNIARSFSKIFFCRNYTPDVSTHARLCYARMSLGWKAQQQQIATLGACWIVSPYSRVAQWKRAGPITQRSVDRNHALLTTFSYETFYFGSICILLLYLLPTIKHRYSLFAEHRVLFLRVHAARVVTTLPICISTT